MDDDFNTGGATGCLFTLAKLINRLAAEEKPRPERDALMVLAGSWLKLLGGRLGILQQGPEEFLQGSAGAADQNGPDPAWVEEMIAKRAEARKAKDFAAADAIRDELGAKGVVLEGLPPGHHLGFEKLTRPQGLSGDRQDREVTGHVRSALCIRRADPLCGQEASGMNTMPTKNSTTFWWTF